MLQSYEAIIDGNGKIYLLENIGVQTTRRAIVTLLPDELKSDDEIEVHFYHPRHANIFTAKIHLRCTGKTALEGLLLGDKSGAFLEPPVPHRPYELAVIRTGEVITPDMTFEQAGVVHGDKIEVRQRAQGGGLDPESYDQIARLIISSGMGLAFLKTMTTVITQLLKSREKTVEYEKNGEKYKLTVSSSVKDFIDTVKALRDDDENSDLQIQDPQGAVEIAKPLEVDSKWKDNPTPQKNERRLVARKPAAASLSDKSNQKRKRATKSVDRKR
jgi:hypothetical protein